MAYRCVAWATPCPRLITPTMPDDIHIHTNRQTRSLSLSTTLIQSCMRLEAPDELVLDYTRAMMGALLFNPHPRQVLMIGLGGGSMLKYLHRHVPEACITTVEISQGVIDLRDEFCIPPDSERLSVVCADGAAFVAAPPRRYDLILVDGFDGSGIPADLSTRRFYTQCRQALTPSGILVANVQAETSQARQLRDRLGKVFDGQSISVESDEGGNEIVTAANDRTDLDALAADFGPRWDALQNVHQDTLAACSTRLERALRKRVR